MPGGLWPGKVEGLASGREDSFCGRERGECMSAKSSRGRVRRAFELSGSRCDCCGLLLGDLRAKATNPSSGVVVYLCPTCAGELFTPAPGVPGGSALKPEPSGRPPRARHFAGVNAGVVCAQVERKNEGVSRSVPKDRSDRSDRMTGVAKPSRASQG